MKGMKFFMAAAMALVAAEALAQRNTPDSLWMTMSEAEKIVPRPFTQPVRSLMGPSTVVVDTIDTQTPGLKILLMEDKSWKYFREPAELMQNALFAESWSESLPNPYNVPLSALPESVRLLLVDATGGYSCPYIGNVYSRFGYRHRRRHQGVDLPLKTGTPVYAAFPGKVRMAKRYAAYGNLVVIRHTNGLETFYGHLSRINVEAGEWVDAGEVIGLGGSTGRSTGAHLHFETRYMGYAFDPQWIIDFETGDLRKSLFVLKKKYLSAASRYVPESIDEEMEIFIGDQKDYAIRDSVLAARKAEEERLAREAAAMRYHTVRSGDTLGRIAINNGTTVNAICRLNPGLKPTTTLKIGRRIRVK